VAPPAPSAQAVKGSFAPVGVVTESIRRGVSSRMRKSKEKMA
jgi:hypothetical protein